MGATLAAQRRGTTKELMGRRGQATSKAALIYQYAVKEQDQGIALALDAIGRSASERYQGRMSSVSGAVSSAG
jgi:hypothetical protein